MTNLIVYGPDYQEQIKQAITELAKDSNIPFDNKYVELGLYFLGINAQSIDVKNPPELKSLVSQSFGEAAIYKYNVAGGVL
jgi:HD-GYP domain-containing protein (c-di-GMP phosphodiesterase class II)